MSIALLKIGQLVRALEDAITELIFYNIDPGGKLQAYSLQIPFLDSPTVYFELSLSRLRAYADT